MNSGLDDVAGVEDGVVGFGGVGHEVVGVEVADEVVELCLCKCSECWDVCGGDDERGVVCVRVHVGVGDGVNDVVDVQEEEGGGERASLRDTVSDCSFL